MNFAKSIGLKGRMGFTLIEILAVIVILAILAVLLLPAVDRVKAMGVQAKACANLRQVGLAMISFANDNQSRLPGPAPVGIHCYYDRGGKSEGPTFVVAQLAQYMGLPDPNSLEPGVKVLVPMLSDPGFAAVIPDPTIAPNFVQNLNLTFPEDGKSNHHILGQLPSGQVPREGPPTLQKLAQIGSLSKLWILTNNDQQLPKTMNNGSGWISLLPPDPVYKNLRLRLFVDCHVEAVPLDAPLL